MTNPQVEEAVKPDAASVLPVLAHLVVIGEATPEQEAELLAFLQGRLASRSQPSQPQGACVQVEGLRVVAEKATPGPWTAALKTVENGWEEPGALVLGGDGNWMIESLEEEDAEHIATFDPPTVLALLDRLVQVEADQENLRLALIESSDKVQSALHQRDAARKEIAEMKRRVMMAVANETHACQRRVGQALSDLKVGNE